MNTEEKSEIFRLKVRVSILEGLLIRLLLKAHVSDDLQHAEAAARSLRSHLENMTSACYRQLGASGDPAWTALYGDDAAAVHHEVISSVDATLAQIVAAP